MIEAVRNGDGDEAARIITQHMGHSRGIFLTQMRRDRMKSESLDS